MKLTQEKELKWRKIVKEETSLLRNNSLTFSVLEFFKDHRKYIEFPTVSKRDNGEIDLGDKNQSVPISGTILIISLFGGYGGALIKYHDIEDLEELLLFIRYSINYFYNQGKYCAATNIRSRYIVRPSFMDWGINSIDIYPGNLILV